MFSHMNRSLVVNCLFKRNFVRNFDFYEEFNSSGAPSELTWLWSLRYYSDVMQRDDSYMTKKCCLVHQITKKDKS